MTKNDRLSKIHRITGITILLVFLGTGVYMRATFPDMYQSNEVIRYLFRANHVYILFSGLLNMVMGMYVSFSEINRKKMLQRGGSWALILSTFVFILAFFLEPPQASPMRPITFAGVALSLGGVILHLFSQFRGQRK